MEKGAVVEGSTGGFGGERETWPGAYRFKGTITQKIMDGVWGYSAQWGHVLGVSSDSESESVGDAQPHSSSRPDSSRSDQRTHAKPEPFCTLVVHHLDTTWTSLAPYPYHVHL